MAVQLNGMTVRRGATPHERLASIGVVSESRSVQRVIQAAAVGARGEALALGPIGYPQASTALSSEGETN